MEILLFKNFFNKNTVKIIRRFTSYESLLSFQTGKDVVTYVVYFNEIQNVKTKLETGINQYNVKAIKMGLDNEVISNLIGNTEKEINILRKVFLHNMV